MLAEISALRICSMRHAQTQLQTEAGPCGSIYCTSIQRLRSRRNRLQVGRSNACCLGPARPTMHWCLSCSEWLPRPVKVFARKARTRQIWRTWQSGYDCRGTSRPLCPQWPTPREHAQPQMCCGDCKMQGAASCLKLKSLRTSL